MIFDTPATQMPPLTVLPTAKIAMLQAGLPFNTDFGAACDAECVDETWIGSDGGERE